MSGCPGDETLLVLVSGSRAAAALSGSACVAVLDVDRREDGAPYIVMEYVDGEALDGRLALEALPPTVRLDAIATRRVPGDASDTAKVDPYTAVTETVNPRGSDR